MMMALGQSDLWLFGDRMLGAQQAFVCCGPTLLPLSNRRGQQSLKS